MLESKSPKCSLLIAIDHKLRKSKLIKQESIRLADLRLNSKVFLHIHSSQLEPKNEKKYPIHRCNKSLEINNTVKYGRTI